MKINIKSNLDFTQIKRISMHQINVLAIESHRKVQQIQFQKRKSPVPIQLFFSQRILFFFRSNIDSENCITLSLYAVQNHYI